MQRHQRIIRLASVSFLVLSFVLVHLPGTDGAAQETMSFSVAGKITQHAGKRLTVNTEGNIVFRVVYNDQTAVIRADGSAGSAKDLAVGTRIHVDGELTESGEIVAAKIKILPAPTASGLE
jgi:hypothetical protein